MAKTIAEINQKIKEGKAVVATAEEIISIAKTDGIKTAAQKIDVVTTGTFGPMCSSGAYFNVGHSKPKIKLGGGKITLNDVPVYTGFAAVDILLGATALPDDDPKNKVYPGAFNYGGAHVIEDLVTGKKVRLMGTSYGTDCYPNRNIDTLISLKSINDAVLFNPRNCYQNYNVAVNLSDRVIYTYMGMLQPNLKNANYCSAGQLSPLMNDPLYLSIGIGTRIFLGGGEGYICWPGTQHNPTVPRSRGDVPRSPAGTLAVIGDLKHMNHHWIKGVSLTGYGVSLAVGIGIPIPILNEDILRYTTVKDRDIYTQVVDYSEAYPQGKTESLGEVNYAQLKSGKIKIGGREASTGGLSSYAKAREIATILKDWIKSGRFFLAEPVANLPGPKNMSNPAP